MFDMRNRRVCFVIFFLVMLLAALAQCQQLTVQTEGGKPTVLARADIEALPHIKVTASVSGTSTTFEGVALEAVLEKGGSWVWDDSEREADWRHVCWWKRLTAIAW